MPDSVLGSPTGILLPRLRATRGIREASTTIALPIMMPDTTPHGWEYVLPAHHDDDHQHTDADQSLATGTTKLDDD